MAEVLRGLADSGVGVLLVEHDRDFVEQVAERVSVLACGRIVAEGDFAGRLLFQGAGAGDGPTASAVATTNAVRGVISQTRVSALLDALSSAPIASAPRPASATPSSRLYAPYAVAPAPATIRPVPT